MSDTTNIPGGSGGAPAIDLSYPGPLDRILWLLQARLQALFPPARFVHHLVSGGVTKSRLQHVLQRTPAIVLSWGGSPPKADSGRMFEAVARWSVLLVVGGASNGSGDKLISTPGAFGLLTLVNAATIGLHGWRPSTKATDTLPAWEATSSMMVTGVGHPIADGFEDAALALAQIDVAVPYVGTLPLGLDALPANMTSMQVNWAFGDTPEGALADTWHVEGSTGVVAQ